MRSTGEPQLSALLHPDRVLFATADLPSSADVVIVGGGIVGCSAALLLAQRGHSVVLLEKALVACEQSGRNWGWVRQQGRASQEVPMMLRSMELWHDWTASGMNTGFTVGGCLYLAGSSKEMEGFVPWLKVADTHQLDTRQLDARQVKELLPGSATRWQGALYTPSDGRAEPGRATPAIAAAAASYGATLIENCAVRCIEQSGGKVSGVVTENGTIKTSSVLLAAGAWTSLLAGALSVNVPQLKLKGTVARTAPGAQVTTGAAWSTDIAIRRRIDGGYTVAHGSLLEHALVPATLKHGWRYLGAWKNEHGAVRLRLDRQFLDELFTKRKASSMHESIFEKQRVLDPKPTAAVIKELRVSLKQHFPALGSLPFAETWAGMIEASPDLLPIIGPVEAVSGLHIATGFSGHGFGLGPGAAECAVQLLCGESPPYDIKPFALTRFFKGRKLAPGPTL